MEEENRKTKKKKTKLTPREGKFKEAAHIVVRVVDWCKNKLPGFKHIRSELELLTFDVKLGSFYLQGHCYFFENGEGYELYPRDWVLRSKQDRCKRSAPTLVPADRGSRAVPLRQR